MAEAIPIEAAKEIAEKYDYEQIVILARKTGNDGLEHVTTYGVDKKHCAVAARMGRVLKHKIMGWPEKIIASEPMQTKVSNN